MAAEEDGFSCELLAPALHGDVSFLGGDAATFMDELIADSTPPVTPPELPAAIVQLPDHGGEDGGRVGNEEGEVERGLERAKKRRREVDSNTIRRRKIALLIEELGQLTGVRSGQAAILAAATKALRERVEANPHAAAVALAATGASVPAPLKRLPFKTSAFVVVASVSHPSFPVLEANDAFYRALGYTPEDVCAGLSSFSLSLPEQQTTLAVSASMAKANRVQRMRDEGAWRHKDGSHTWWVSTIDIDHDGGTATVVAVPHPDPRRNGGVCRITLEMDNGDGTTHDVELCAPRIAAA